MRLEFAAAALLAMPLVSCIAPSIQQASVAIPQVSSPNTAPSSSPALGYPSFEKRTSLSAAVGTSIFLASNVPISDWRVVNGVALIHANGEVTPTASGKVSLEAAIGSQRATVDIAAVDPSLVTTRLPMNEDTYFSAHSGPGERDARLFSRVDDLADHLGRYTYTKGANPDAAGLLSRIDFNTESAIVILEKVRQGSEPSVVVAYSDAGAGELRLVVPGISAPLVSSGEYQWSVQVLVSDKLPQTTTFRWL